MQRVAHVYLQTEGRDIGSASARARAHDRGGSRTRGLDARFVGQVALMRETFGGLGLAIGFAVMIVFMIVTEPRRRRAVSRSTPRTAACGG